jgi:hypothetical protein
MSRRLIMLLFMSAVVVVLLHADPHLLWAQTSFGTILGSVSDPTQAAVPEAKVTITNAQTGVGREMVTSASGDYRFDSLLPGVYNIKAESQGFQPTEVTGVVLQVNQIATVNVQLTIGAVSQTVKVTATAPLLDTATATVGTDVNNTSVVTLPLNGRSYTDLVLLTPGAVPRAATFAISGGHDWAVSGNMPDQTNFTLDGTNNNEVFFRSFASQPSIDAIQEFKVQTNMTSAEYGQSGGANVSVALKAGTNQLHGSAFEFVRNDLFDANEFFRNYSNLSKPAFRQNQWGFVLGGPVYIPKIYDGRDKFFFMVNYEGFKIREPETSYATLPTMNELSGDLTNLPPVYDPATTTQIGTDSQGNPIYSRTQISCNGTLNVICSNRIDPAMAEYAKIFYARTNTTGAANEVNLAPFRLDRYQVNIRADYKITNNLSFFARYSPSNATQVTPQAITGLTTTYFNPFPTAEASWTYVPTPTTVVDFKVGLDRTVNHQNDNNPAPGVASFLASYPLGGIGVQNPSVPLFPAISLENYTGPSQSGTYLPNTELEYIGSVSKIMGKHSLKTGFMVLNDRGVAGAPDDGGYGFSHFATADPQNPVATGSSVASFLLGLPDTGSRWVGPNTIWPLFGFYQFYVQDDIKVTRRLTLNLGLRYEYDQVPYDKYNHESDFSLESDTYVWTGYNPVTGQGPNVRRSIRDPDWNNFAPRVGLAYLLNSKTTVRSGFGIFYAPNVLWEIQQQRGQWPYAEAQTFQGLNRYQTLTPIETAFPNIFIPTPGTPPSAAYSISRTDRVGYVQDWNLGIQRELARNVLLEVNYVGNAGVKLMTNDILNNPLPGPGTIGSPQHPRPYPLLTNNLIASQDRGSSLYHGLQAKLEKRFSNGLQLLATYAWGHEIDINGGTSSTESFPQDENDIQADRAPGAIDYRNIFTAGYVYELPFGRGKHFLSGVSGAANQIVGGWEITGITHYNSGMPVNVTLTFDNANTGTWVERPDRAPGGVPSERVSVPGDKTQGWLDPAEFSIPTQYTYGNLGRDTERGPGFGNWDFSIFKNFPLPGEQRMIQFRTEFFNGFNNVNLGSPGAGFCQPIATCDPNFGRIFGTQNDSREIQFALKFLF